MLLDMVPWVPAPLIVLGLVALAVAVALGVHALLWALFRRFLKDRHPFLHQIAARTQALSRFAFIMVAVSVVVPIAPLSTAVSDSAHRFLLAAFIVFVGWLATVAANLAIERYIGRFKLDTADNLLARKAVTQMRVLKRILDSALILVTIALALMSFESVREFGVSLFASAGIAGIAVGLAARPLLENFLAGVQLAITQPIRLGDVVIVEGEYGVVEEITSTYVVLKLWDWRRMVVPLRYFFEKPFQNWTRTEAALIGTVLIYADYTVPVDQVRAKLNEIVKQSTRWDGRVVNLQVTDAKDNVIELRVLVSGRDSPTVFDLRAEVREKLITYLQQELPSTLPTIRQRFDSENPVLRRTD